MLVKIGRSSAASVILGLGHTCHKPVLSCCLYTCDAKEEQEVCFAHFCGNLCEFRETN